jgi:hypothetical protein
MPYSSPTPAIHPVRAVTARTIGERFGVPVGHFTTYRFLPPLIPYRKRPKFFGVSPQWRENDFEFLA